MNQAPATVDTLYGAGHWLMSQARHRDAMAIFHTMLLVDAAEMRGWLALGMCHEAADEPEKALAIYELASQACGASAARCTVARARLLRSLGDEDGATSAYELAARQITALGDDELEEMLSLEVSS